MDETGDREGTFAEFRYISAGECPAEIALAQQYAQQVQNRARIALTT